MGMSDGVDMRSKSEATDRCGAGSAAPYSIIQVLILDPRKLFLTNGFINFIIE